MEEKKNNLQCSIREYKLTDRENVISMFRDGVMEHVYPAFFKAMSDPDHIGVALSISMAGYVLGGSSYFQAFLFGAAWAGLVYYCCQEIYQGYLARRLGTDMADIQKSFLDDANSRFWVAEAEVNGAPKVVGIVAVVGRQGGGEGGLNGAPAAGEGEVGDGSYGELVAMVVAFKWRRRGLGVKMAQTAVEFCKERGLPRLVGDASSPQTAGIGLYRKLGFVQSSAHSNAHANKWYSTLSKISVMRMQKFV